MGKKKPCFEKRARAAKKKKRGASGSEKGRYHVKKGPWVEGRLFPGRKGVQSFWPKKIAEERKRRPAVQEEKGGSRTENSSSFLVRLYAPWWPFRQERGGEPVSSRKIEDLPAMGGGGGLAVGKKDKKKGGSAS